MNELIRLLIADDHPIVRHGICMCLAHQEKIQVVGEAGNGREALSQIRELRPDVVLMDINMPQMNGLVVTDLLRHEMPQVKVLILSMYSNAEYALRMVQCGARGFVLKEAPPEEIVHAIEAVHAGRTHFSSDVARVALNLMVCGNGKAARPARLSNREWEVLRHIAEGESNLEIAGQLEIGVRTVESHREHIMRKLDIHSIAGLTRFAITRGIISMVSLPPPKLRAPV